MGSASGPASSTIPFTGAPTTTSAASKFRVDVSKNSSTAASGKDGEFVTSTTTPAPASALGGFMTEPKVWGFLYGLFINREVLARGGLIPDQIEVARLAHRAAR